MSDHNHDHEHEHEHQHAEVDPAEQESLAHELASDLDAIFVRFVRGEIDFAEVSFATYDVLQDLHIVSTGAYELVQDDDETDDDDDSYDEEEAAREQEDLSGEPSRP